MNRKNIGIFFTFNKQWIGGNIYLINLLKCLNELDDNCKPEIIFLYANANKGYLKEVKEIQYPYIQYVQWNVLNPYKGYILSVLQGKNLFIDPVLKKYKLDGIFPLNDLPVAPADKRLITVSWLPDFQHKEFPGYFSKLNLAFREIRFQRAFQKTKALVLSSEHSYQQYLRYSWFKKTPVHVLPFVSVIDENVVTPKGIEEKYNIPEKYFIVCNQFYQHKNHELIFRSLKIVRNRGWNIPVVFTGKMEDYRNPDFIRKLKEYIVQEKIEDNCIFLGVIPREEQIWLIKNAIAVLQPSKYEGWSTVIEDAKSLSVPVIASNIAVHIEQLKDQGYYVSPDNPIELANFMINYYTTPPRIVTFEFQRDRMKKFALGFMNIFQS